MTFTLPNDWFTWGLVLLIGFPFAMIVLGELLQNLARYRVSAFATPITILRTIGVPMLFIALLLRGVMGYDSGTLAVRIADTICWIVLINLALAVVNVIFFGEGAGLGASARMPKLLLDLLRLFIVLVAAAIVVSTIWGVDLGGLLTALGVGSIVIGLALQDTLGSVFSGIAMLSTRQFKVGDTVQIGADEGVLTNMNWRTVTLRNWMGDEIILPNSSVSRGKLIVLGAGTGKRAFLVDLKLAYDHAPQEVMTLMEEVAKATPGVARTPAPNASLAAFEDYAVRYNIFMIAEDLNMAVLVGQQFQINLWYAAQRKGLVFPAQFRREFQVPGDAREQRRPSADALADALHESAALPVAKLALLPLVQNARREIYRAGEVLMAQGAASKQAYVVLQGSATGCYQPDVGRAIAIQDFEPGQVIMFKSLLRGTDSPLQVKASSDLVVIAIPAHDLREFLASQRELAEEMETILSGRDDSMARALQQAFPGQAQVNGSASRVDYLRDMFRV